jgi:hypothetical protein
MKRLKPKCNGFYFFEKIIRTTVVKELGLLVDEKEARRSKARSEAE